MGRAPVWMVAMATACVVGPPPSDSEGALPFRPAAGGPDAWIVTSFEVDLICPDDERARFVAVHPEAPEGPLPTALVFHSGAFDHVLAPDPLRPLDGPHRADPSRLEAAWAIRHVHATLGMFPSQVPGEVHDGSLPGALAREGVALLLPTNCWGDLWGARSGGNDSDVAADYFRREGRAAAELAYRSLIDPATAGALGVSLPFEAEADSILAVGLGEGARAIPELLSIDRDADGEPDLPLEAALLDSAPDDLAPWLQSPTLYAEEAQGVQRIFPAAAAIERGSLGAAASLPPRTVYVWASDGPVWPAGMHASALDRLQGEAGAEVIDAPGAHVATNGPDPALMARVVALLVP